MKAKVLGTTMLTLMIIALTLSVVYNWGCDISFNIPLFLFGIAYVIGAILLIIKGE